MQSFDMESMRNQNNKLSLETNRSEGKKLFEFILKINGKLSEH